MEKDFFYADKIIFSVESEKDPIYNWFHCACLGVAGYDLIQDIAQLKQVSLVCDQKNIFYLEKDFCEMHKQVILEMMPEQTNFSPNVDKIQIKITSSKVENKDIFALVMSHFVITHIS